MEKTVVYERPVHYYETDKMAIVHHANYVHYMEEARLFFLDRNGLSYDRLEKDGFLSPVVSLECRYRHPLRYGDVVRVAVRLLSYSGFRFAFAYRMENQEGTLVFEGTSTHCATDAEGRPLPIRRRFPAVDELLSSLLPPEEGEGR